MEWTEEMTARLRVLWDEGRSTAEIGRAVGISKNAIVGKAHRLGLASRPSPIHRDALAKGAPDEANEVLARAEAAAAPLSPEEPVARSQQMAIRSHGAARPKAKAPQLVEAAASSASDGARAMARAMSCCWPIGEPATPGFRFCGEAALPGKPYCARHAELAYVRIRDRREDAA